MMSKSHHLVAAEKAHKQRFRMRAMLVALATSLLLVGLGMNASTSNPSREASLFCRHLTIKGGSPSPSSSPPIELTEGVESDKFSVEEDEYKIFFISVPSSSIVTCTTHADYGDLDLYMNRNGEIGVYACISELESSLDESCTISAGPERAYAILYGYDETPDFTVTCTSSPALEPIELMVGVESANYSVVEDEYKSFFINVSSSSIVTCMTDADDGDLDLYMNRNGEIGSYDCFSEFGETSRESCTISAGPEGAYAITYGFFETPDFTVTCTSSPALEPIELMVGVESANFSVEKDEYKSFFINVPSSSSIVTCMADADDGDLDLYMNRNGEIGSYDCISDDPDTSLKICSISAGPGRAYAITHGYAETSNFTVTCTISPSIELTDGVESAKFSAGEGELKSFFINVPSASIVTCTTSADNGDLDLFMNQNGGLDEFDCISDSDTSFERCKISAGPGRTYALTAVLKETSDFTVTCTIG
jgi:hypothetical protein